MTIFDRPSETVFASGAKPGEVIDFPDILRGWGITLDQTEGKPPLEWMNAAFLRLDQAVRYFMQRGMPEWSATDDYPVGSYVQHGGLTYRSLLASTDTEPGTAALTWTEWGVTRSAFAALAFSGKFGDLSEVPGASTTIKGLIELATATEAKALTDAVRAITPSTLGAVLAEFRSGIPGAAFAEIDALAEDNGPIICTDMAGQLYVWTVSAYFTGYRNPLCGTIPQHFAPTPRAWEMPVTGGVWSDSDPKQKRLIALFREYGHVVAIGDWLPGWGRIADLGGGDWKAPDLQDVFLRMAGTDADTANPRATGTYQADALQNLVGTVGVVQTNSVTVDGVFKIIGPVGNISAGSGVTSIVGMDASFTARTSTETRGPNAAVASVILV